MNKEVDFLGELEPLHVKRHLKRPDRRQVSKRWLFSSVLVGLTSFMMMGGALFAALDGLEQLSVPAQAYKKDNNTGPSELLALKGNHPRLSKIALGGDDSNIMMVSTISQSGNTNVVKVRPFMNVKSPIAFAPKSNVKYPGFNPLTVFSESGNLEIISENDAIMYGADVEGEVTLNITEFPKRVEIQKTPKEQRSAEIIQQIRAIASDLESGGSYVSALAQFDDQRFSESNGLLFSPSIDVTITAENVSVLAKSYRDSSSGIYYQDRTIEITKAMLISEAMTEHGVHEADINDYLDVLASDLGNKKFREGDLLEAWFKHDHSGTQKRTTLEMLSVYRGAVHLTSIARNDKGAMVYAPAPEKPQNIIAESERPSINQRNLPSIYDGIYRAALHEGLTKDLVSSLIKIFAFDVDFRSQIQPTDQLEVFLSLEEGSNQPSIESEILYAGIKLGNVDRRYYRFRDQETGRIDYYDQTGKSAKKFLLRQPVPNGRFRSGFGMRRHPISRRYKLHAGVDWAAPRGTPILAAGNGVIQKAGWSGTGYGKQTILRHANGYETSYSHQTAVAKGIRPGVRVRQGQIIGYVGSTGYSTGPHLHYEVKVNNNHVDPMRIRLPRGKVLKEKELAAFEAERDRIDQLINSNDNLNERQLASN
ncbi:MAG: M23 family metallopeptidase [Pseudomonadota bacterium]